jgi:hypothetical protein
LAKIGEISDHNIGPRLTDVAVTSEPEAENAIDAAAASIVDSVLARVLNEPTTTAYVICVPTKAA